jgi:XapX domain-containing protein
MKIVLGLLLGLLIGTGCRLAGVPLPAPPALVGALLVLAMTVGYILADRFASRREARLRDLCGGPSGEPAAGDGTARRD